MENRNALEIAKRMGNSIAGELGETALVELELVYATKLLPRFSDDLNIRKNQNVLFYWSLGYYKSTILRVFGQTIPTCLKLVDITSMTPEKIFGSIDEKKRHIIQPAFTKDVDFVIVSELSSLLGQHDSMRQLVNHMNAVLEGERVARQTLKLGQGEINEAELIELESKGISYNAKIGELSYAPNVCVLAATRPLDNRYFTYLNKSGHFSRYHVIQRRITDREASEILHTEHKLDQEVMEQLKEVNSALSKIEISKMLRPSEQYMASIYDSLEGLAKDEISGKRNLTFADVISPRVKGDIIRELVAHAFLRTASQNVFTGIQELQYTQEDVDFVLERIGHFVEFNLNPIIAEDYSAVPKLRRREKVKEAILSHLSDGTERHIDELIKLCEPLSVCPATIYNALNELLDEHQVKSPRHAHYITTGKRGSEFREGTHIE